MHLYYCHQCVSGNVPRNYRYAKTCNTSEKNITKNYIVIKNLNEILRTHYPILAQCSISVPPELFMGYRNGTLG